MSEMKAGWKNEIDKIPFCKVYIKDQYKHPHYA